MATNQDLVMLLGEVKALVERLRDDFIEEKSVSKENRVIIHRRLDEQAERVAKIDNSVGISARDLESLKETLGKHQEQITPTIQEWQRLKVMGMTISGLVAVAGLSFGAFAATASDLFVAWVRHWLKIGG